MIRSYRKFSFPVRDSGLNPFLTNPIHAVKSDPDKFGNLLEFYINHAVDFGDRLLVCGWDKDGTEFQAELIESGLSMANHHEAERFESLLRMLRIPFEASKVEEIEDGE